MNSNARRFFGVSSFVVALLSVLAFGAASQDPQTAFVEVQGLKQTYGSCEIVHVSVENISAAEIYTEVYAEDSKSDSWKDVDYTYDLRDPNSLYIKRVLQNPEMLKPGNSFNLDYDRCAKPRFVKQSKSFFAAAIKKKDATASAKVLQRIRVEVYVLDRGHVQLKSREWSRSFERDPKK